MESPTRISPKGAPWRCTGKADLVDARRAVDGAKLVEEAAVAQRGERGRRRHRLVDRAGIGVHQRHAVAVDERRVVDLGVVADHRLQQRADRVIVLQNRGNRVARLGGILRVSGRLRRQLGLQRLARRVQHLVGDEIGVVVALVDALAKDLRDVDDTRARQPGRRPVR